MNIFFHQSTQLFQFNYIYLPASHQTQQIVFVIKIRCKKIRCVWCWKGKWMNFQFFHDINEKLKKMRHSHLLRRKLILLTFDIKQIFSSCNYHFCHDCDVRVLFSCCCCADVWFNSQQEIYKNWVHICIRKFIIQLDIHE
jgi:hypothetical protein